MYHHLKRKVMAKDVDLTSREWLDLVFEGKNKEYGAYVLRESSSDRHIKALAIVIIGGMALIALPRLVKSVAPASPRVIETSGVVMIDIPDKPVETPIAIPVVSTPAQQLVKTIKFTPPVIVRDDLANPDNSIENQIDLTNAGAAIGTITNPDGVEFDGVRPEDTFTEIVGTPTKSTIFEVPEIPAVFPGGEKELMKWLSANIIYPMSAIDRGMEGQVILRFVVGPDGSVGNVEVIRRSLDSSLDQEAVRVVKKMPKWIPGKQNGNAVYVYYTLPVRFKLQN
jgi:protein TonB